MTRALTIFSAPAFDLTTSWVKAPAHAGMRAFGVVMRRDEINPRALAARSARHP